MPLDLKLEVLESLSIAGSVNRANEDAFGSNAHCAFVIDGATGLGDQQYIAEAKSDAAWLSNVTRLHLQNYLLEASVPQEVIRDLCTRLRIKFLAATEERNVPAYAWPTASFALLHAKSDGLVFVGLGDCTLYLRDGSSVKALNPLKDFATIEADFAAHHLQASGGFNRQRNLLSDPDTLKTLRRIRSMQNSAESGIWTLGLVPEAADHLYVQTLDVGSKGEALLCSDGFSALVNDYQRYTEVGLLDAAHADGLPALMKELRHIEQVVDPEGENFPRFKQSDDATAMLVSWSV